MDDSLKRGVEQAEVGQLVDLGSFAQFWDVTDFCTWCQFMRRTDPDAVCPRHEEAEQ